MAQPNSDISPASANLDTLPYFMNGDTPGMDLGTDLTGGPDLAEPNAAYAHLRTTTPSGNPRRARRRAETSVSGEAVLMGEEIWEAVEALRAEVAARQAEAISARFGTALDREGEEELGRAVIADVIRDHVARQISAEGQRAGWSDAVQAKVRGGLFDSLFRLGRIQPLIDDPTIEDIHVLGHDKVFIQRSGSTKLEPSAPVVNSNQELIALLQQFSRMKGDAARDFSAANPSLHLDLPSGDLQVRLHAAMPPQGDRPTAIFRIHRHLDISLEDMVEMGTMNQGAAHFLATAVTAGKSIVVAGVPGDGKTTMVRALAERIDPMAQIVTIETERELHLEKLSTRIVPPIAYEYVPPGEGGKGERTLSHGIEDGLRDNARYLIAGEVRGSEIVPMVRAMQVGAGTLSTTHAFDPTDCVEALVGLGRNAYGEDYMARQLGRHLNLVVQMGFVQIGEREERRVVQISEVRVSTDGTRGVSTHDVFRLDVEGGEEQARFLGMPEDPRFVRDLRRAGLDEALLERGR